MRYLFCLFLLFSISAMAQDAVHQEHWPDGTLRSTRIHTGDRILFITYHENGRMNESGAFLNGRCDGVWKRYTDTGALLLYARFNNGQRQGTWEFRDAEDHSLGRLHFNNGVLASGEQFNATGQLIARREY